VTEARSAVQHCPYCAGTALWPSEAGHGAWTCRECGRVFSVRFLGLAGDVLAAAPQVQDVPHR
jgi:ribosomal protein L37AE/L43A